MTQTDLIKLIAEKYPNKKITQQFLSLVLNGKRRVSWDTAKVLAEISGTTPALWMDAEPHRLKKIVEKLAA